MRTHLLLSFLLVIVVMLACIPFIDDEKTPNAPSKLVAVSITVDKVELQWKDNSKDEEGFRVFRDDQILATTQQSRYTDNSVKPNTNYNYKVEAYNDIGSKSSNTLTVSTPAEDGGPGPSPGKPKTPTNLIAKTDFHHIILTWKDNANNETHYIIKRADNSEEKLEKNSTDFVDKNLEHNKAYSYQVYAVNNEGSSGIASISAKTRGRFTVRWNRAMDRREVDGQLVENGWAAKYEVIVEPKQGGAPVVVYTGSDTSCALEMDKPFCVTVKASDSHGNTGNASPEVCSE